MYKEEVPISGSPIVTLDSGKKCIPQHFLLFSHTVESVRKLFKRVSFSDKFNPYIYMDNDCICLQIEIIGHENYPKKKSTSKEKEIKKVYGRKWRVEKNLPTSEILQTALLAIKKALEHEIRELFCYTANDIKTTPLNNHQDFPLIVREFDNLLCSSELLSENSLKSWVKNLKFNKQEINVLGLTKHKNIYLIDIKFGHSKERNKDINFFRWLESKEVTLIVSKPTKSQIIYALMDSILKESDLYVEENFLFDGVPRFSRRISPLAISKLSLETRNEERLQLKKELIEKMREINSIIDQTRIPIPL